VYADEDADLQEYLGKPVEERALHVLFSVMMNMRDLPEWACDRSPLQFSTLTFPAYVACVEGYFTNARLVSEFFWKMPKGDITARTFVPDWTPPPAIARRRERVWLMSSKHIVHFGKARVPETTEDWQQEDLSYGALMRITRDGFKAFELFVEAYEHREGTCAEQTREMVSEIRPHTRKELAALRAGNAKLAPVVIDWW
jgi:hypothetical protein